MEWSKQTGYSGSLNKNNAKQGFLFAQSQHVKTGRAPICVINKVGNGLLGPYNHKNKYYSVVGWSYLWKVK